MLHRTRVTVEATPGSHIAGAAAEAVWIAETVNDSVTFIHNDTRVEIVAGDDEVSVVEKWYRQRPDAR